MTNGAKLLVIGLGSNKYLALPISKTATQLMYFCFSSDNIS